MDITYKLGGEQIYAKVGEHCELQYPNDLFLQLLKVVIFTVTIFLTIILLVQSNVHFALFVLHIDILVIIALIIFMIRIGKEWINTLIVCIDTIFVIEEVVRKKRRQVPTSTYDNQVSYSIQRRNNSNVVKEDIPQKNDDYDDTPGYLDVDMNKLNKALQGGFKIV